ncbi:MAG: protease inhibitor I42 family protein [Ignavibacteria bacterium]|nr:protease inhibitor I42 family protein [Ignavibacteria bacterium]
MKPNSMKRLIVVLTFFLLLACRSQKLSDEQNIYDYEIKLGKSFTIELISNPTTGYSWKWVNKKFDTIVDTFDYEYVPNNPQLIGGGGKEVWNFRGSKLGVDTIMFEYNRSWEPESTVEIKKFVVRVYE